MKKHTKDFLAAMLFSYNWQCSELEEGDYSISDLPDEFSANVEGFIDGFIQSINGLNWSERNQIENAYSCARSFGGSVFWSLSGHGVGFLDEEEEWGEIAQRALGSYAKNNYRDGDTIFELVDLFLDDQGKLQVENIDWTLSDPTPKPATYTASQLAQINIESDVVTMAVRDYEGNKTFCLGANDIEAIDDLIAFLKRRKKGLGNPLSC